MKIIFIRKLKLKISLGAKIMSSCFNFTILHGRQEITVAYFLFFLTLGLCSCKEEVALENVTPENYSDLELANPSENPETFPLWISYGFSDIGQFVSSPALPSSHGPKGSEKIIESATPALSNEQLFSVYTDKTGSISVTSNRTGDVCKWVYDPEFQDPISFQVNYNFRDSSHLQRFNKSLDTYLQEKEGVYKKTKDENGMDIMIIPVNGYYLIGHISKGNVENIGPLIFSISFVVYHKHKRHK